MGASVTDAIRTLRHLELLAAEGMHSPKSVTEVGSTLAEWFGAQTNEPPMGRRASRSCVRFDERLWWPSSLTASLQPHPLHPQHAIEEVEEMAEDGSKVGVCVGTVVITGKKPTLKRVVAGIELCVEGLEADAKERAEKKAAEEKAE